ncbi:hypothetical protein [Xanthomonas phaseoli]|nr:hypothetical protein [Xanthomonas phaseoli]
MTQMELRKIAKHRPGKRFAERLSNLRLMVLPAFYTLETAQ